MDSDDRLHEDQVFSEIAEFVEDSSTFAVCGHVNVDGDCVGSVLGMVAALRQAGKDAVPLLADGGIPPHKYAFLHGYQDYVRASDYTGTPDVLIQVDTATSERMGEAEVLLQRCAKSVSIDHHPGNGVGADFNYSDPGSASASMLVWKLARAMVGEPDPFVAMACYTGLLTDTGRFQFQNTDADALALAAEMVSAGADPALVAAEVFQNRSMGALLMEGRVISRMGTTPGGRIAYSWIAESDYDELGVARDDAEGMVDVVRSVEDIEVALLMRGRPDSVRCSIRAKREFDVSKIAAMNGGGGHKAAAGFTVEGRLEDAMPRIIAQMEQVEKTMILDGCSDMEAL